jgi:6-phosphogluconolactonase (cycloisomerase 2 family)
VYAANASGVNLVATYSITPSSGALALSGSTAAAGILPISLVLDPSGRFAYVANDNSNDISAYVIDATSGVPAPVGGSPFAAGNEPRSIVID